MDYSKTKIYKIWSTQGPKIYVGSTCKDRLCQRMNTHRESYKCYKKDIKNGYATSYLLFDEYGIENCFIELIEAKECCNKDERNKLEGHYIRTLECVNKVIPNRTKKEFRKDNIIQKTEYLKKYRELNKDKIKESKQKKINCECGSIISFGNIHIHNKSKKHQQISGKPLAD